MQEEIKSWELKGTEAAIYNAVHEKSREQAIFWLFLSMIGAAGWIEGVLPFDGETQSLIGLAVSLPAYGACFLGAEYFAKRYAAGAVRDHRRKGWGPVWVEPDPAALKAEKEREKRLQVLRTWDLDGEPWKDQIDHYLGDGLTLWTRPTEMGAWVYDLKTDTRCNVPTWVLLKFWPVFDEIVDRTSEAEHKKQIIFWLRLHTCRAALGDPKALAIFQNNEPHAIFEILEFHTIAQLVKRTFKS